MNLKEIKDLIELVSDKGFAEFEIERQGFRLRISRFQGSQPQVLPSAATPIIISSSLPSAPEVLSSNPQRALAAVEEPAAATDVTGVQKRSDAERPVGESDLHIIKSPIVG